MLFVFFQSVKSLFFLCASIFNFWHATSVSAVRSLLHAVALPFHLVSCNGRLVLSHRLFLVSFPAHSVSSVTGDFLLVFWNGPSSHSCLTNRIILPDVSKRSSTSLSSHFVSSATGFSRLTSRNTCPFRSRLTLSRQQSQLLISRLGTLVRPFFASLCLTRNRIFSSPVE